jgi:hypothetical protein
MVIVLVCHVLAAFVFLVMWLDVHLLAGSAGRLLFPVLCRCYECLVEATLRLTVSQSVMTSSPA